ncbi:hypothetical protein F5882DRAFT_465091 [Hyaloscypha sp. PMI_1271]|nr:hypothetical protein F5882DRAFT_465091 [Hyaloscypha sp. PMI_1271]
MVCWTDAAKNGHKIDRVPALAHSRDYGCLDNPFQQFSRQEETISLHYTSSGLYARARTVVHSNILHSALTMVFDMATTSELDIISSNPIKGGLCIFRRLFESTRADLGVADSSDAVQVVFSTAAVAAKNLLLDLILALQNEPAARILQSRIADRTLSGGLTILYSRVDSSQWSVVSAVPLVEQVLSIEPDLATWSDAEFWSAVFGLVS